ncbi:MAG: glycosyltransferase [Patescibacteria group bacterium]|nr:glycosyltransferase [Patescibacteria group bacterium]MDE2438862.1 glycosyltransferase [Patescibacteria group bacterium]
MNIAFFSDNFYPELSGIADSIILTGTELARRGHIIHYFVPHYDAREYRTAGTHAKELILGSRITIHRLPSFHVPGPTLQTRAVVPNPLFGLLKAKPDIIHSHSFFGPGIDALIWARRNHIPLLGTNHTHIESFIRYSPIHHPAFQRFLKRYITWYYNQCVTVSAPSDFLIQDMQKNGLHASSHVISNPIDPSFFIAPDSKKTLKARYGLAPLTILYAGRIASEKNIQILFDAFLPLAHERPDVDLLIVGQGTLRKILERRRDTSGIASRIKLLGPFLGENKQEFFDLFHASDILVMPSTSETQSMVVLQGMACGMPVVAARTAALPEIVTAERGVLFNPTDAPELTTHLKNLCQSQEYREQLGHQARIFAAQFSVESVANKWEMLYKSIYTTRARI